MHIVPEPTKDALQAAHARAHADYESWKRDVVVWLETEGRDPERLRGYAESTVRQSNYKIDQLMRWLWQQRGYTTEFTPDDADASMLEAMDYASEIMESMDQATAAVENIHEFYFGPNGALADAIEGMNAANELAQQLNNVDFGLANSRLAATSIATRAFSEQLVQTPVYNLRTIQNPIHNSDLYELLETTEEIPGMVDDLAWMGAQPSWNPEPTPPEPDYTENPFHDDVLETQNLLADYLWASIRDEGNLSDDLTEGQNWPLGLVSCFSSGLLSERWAPTGLDSTQGLSWVSPRLTWKSTIGYTLLATNTILLSEVHGSRLPPVELGPVTTFVPGCSGKVDVVFVHLVELCQLPVLQDPSGFLHHRLPGRQFVDRPVPRGFRSVQPR